VARSRLIIKIVAHVNGPKRRGISSLYKPGLISLMIAAGAAFLFFGSQASDAFVYAKPVDQVVGVSDWVGKGALRVDGDLKPGSIQFREKPCEWRFVLTRSGKELPVRYPLCVVPDTFRDAKGVEVTVQGNLQSDGWFVANQLIPRCPSKYERAQRAQRGELMPHDGRR
jgi:cytochrome c-type biogenesis protein CcmE